MKLTKESTAMLGREILEAAQVVAEKHGVTIRGGGGSYNDFTFDCKLKVLASSNPMAEYERQFTTFAELQGFQPNDLGCQVKLVDGCTYFIAGYKSANRKMPLLVSDAFPVRTDDSGRVIGLRKVAIEAVVELIEEED